VEANASLDSLTPRFAVEAHLANVCAEEAVAQTEQRMTQEEEVSSEPGEQAGGGSPHAAARLALAGGSRSTLPAQ
jgi:hypothetical protein